MFLAALVFSVENSSFGAVSSSTNEVSDLIPLEKLLDMTVTSPGRKAEPRFRSATAVEVLTEEDIRRYGSHSIPDTLRLVPGLHVARYIGNSYAVTARGFSGAAANKMQVLMDGRSLYTPLFSGVFWEVQDTLLMDINRIEVIRGPGATMWGANAVNGVISITSKSARDTLGTLVQGGGGNEEVGFGAVRHGGRAGESTFWRVYSKYRYRDEQILSDGSDAGDFSEHLQGGFRTDTYLRDVHQLTFQGDVFMNDFGTLNQGDANHQGANVLGRWTRHFSEGSDLQMQLYYDRNDREVSQQYREERNTIDADLQHRFHLGDRNEIVWGGNYRFSTDDTAAGSYSFEPAERSLHLLTVFAQDSIALVPDRLFLTLGTKLEHNDFSGFEWQPSAHLAYIATDRQMVWGAVSRAVRTPTRIENDLRFRPLPASPVTIRGNPDFESETLIAYELGYRVHPVDSVSVEISSFYNDYDSLRTLEPTATVIPLTLMNKREGETWGFESSVRYEAAAWWRLTASYTVLEEDLKFDSGSLDPTGGNTEANDPEQMARLRSSITLPHRIEFDQVLRFVDELPNPSIPAYLELDLRVAWRPKPGLELSIVGMNLLDSAHPEFNGGSALQPEVQRSVYGKIMWLF